MVVIIARSAHWQHSDEIMFSCKSLKQIGKRFSNGNWPKTPNSLCGLLRWRTVGSFSAYFGLDDAETTVTWSSALGNMKVINITHKALLSHALTYLWLFPPLMLLTMFSLQSLSHAPPDPSFWQPQNTECLCQLQLLKKWKQTLYHNPLFMLCSRCQPGWDTQFPLHKEMWFWLFREIKPLQSLLYKPGIWAHTVSSVYAHGSTGSLQSGGHFKWPCRCRIK